MSKMVERVAKALYREIPGSEESWAIWQAEKVACAAISAMSEPMPEMIKAGNTAMNLGANALGIFQAMINEALK